MVRYLHIYIQAGKSMYNSIPPPPGVGVVCSLSDSPVQILQWDAPAYLRSRITSSSGHHVGFRLL